MNENKNMSEMKSPHPIEKILDTTMRELKEMVDVNTIVGDPFVAPGGISVIPVSKVSFGFVSGGGEYPPGKGQSAYARQSFAGGSASGITISPVAFLTADTNGVNLLPAIHRNCIDKLLEHAPKMICELKELLKKEEASDEAKE